MPKFFTQFERPTEEECPLEYCPESMTETAGYIPTDRLIQSFQEAGLRLEIARDFDWPNAESVPDDYAPATFASRLDALALDADVRQRLEAFAAQRRAEAERKLAEAKASEAKVVSDGST